MNKYTETINKILASPSKLHYAFTDLRDECGVFIPGGGPGNETYDTLVYNLPAKQAFLEFLTNADQETADKMLQTWEIPTVINNNNNKYSAFIPEQIAAADQETADEMLLTLTYPTPNPAKPVVLEVRGLNQQELALRNLPFIQAIAEGKTIQRFSGISKEWKDSDGYDLHCFDCTDDQFRIKPDTKTYRVALMHSVFDKSRVYTTVRESKEQENDLEALSDFVRWLTDTVEYEV